MSFGSQHTRSLTRRATLGIAVGLVGGGVLYTSRSYRPPSQPLHIMAQQPAAGPTAATGLGPVSGMMSGPLPRADAETRAVNLRDVGEVSGVLRKGLLFRCSQIYTPEVLRDLKIKTVVDLRGRAEKGSKKHHTRQKDSENKSATASVADSGSPRPLLRAEARDAIAAAEAHDVLTNGQQRAAEEAGIAPATQTQDFVVMRGGLDSVSSSDESDSGAVPPSVSSTSELASSAMQDAMAQIENFNLIPSKEFGLTMLKMPRRVWAAAFGNLVTGQDPRRPFVDAFANEQLLGFTRYYKIILEHSKKNIAAVLRVFARDRNLPALVHCAHGKDRTGVIIMLLLMVCGVEHEAIVGDYVQSEMELRRYRESLVLPDPSGARGAIIPLNDVIIASTAETLRAVLVYMDEQYISVDNYLASCGMSPAEVSAIRANLMTPQALASLQQAGNGSNGGGGSSSGGGVQPAAAPAGPTEL